MLDDSYISRWLALASCKGWPAFWKSNKMEAFDSSMFCYVYEMQQVLLACSILCLLVMQCVRAFVRAVATKEGQHPAKVYGGSSTAYGDLAWSGQLLA